MPEQMGEGAGKRPSRLLADRGLGRVGRLMDRDQAHFPRDPEPPLPDAAGLLGRLLLLIFLKMQFTTLPLFFNKELCKEPASRHFAADLDNESQEEQYPTCEHCGKTFLKRNKLNRHINEAHLDLKKYSCDTCGKLFKRPQHLKRHLLSHNNERPFKCDYENCPQSFTCSHHLKRHVKLIHEQKKIFQCEQCSFSTFKKKALNRHKQEHETNTKLDLSAPLFACTIDDCGRTFTRLRNLQKHKKVKHDKIKDFQCLLCHQRFSHKCTLKRHMQKQHQDPSASSDQATKVQIFME